MNPSLPQKALNDKALNDLDIEKRAQYLIEQRKAYEYKYDSKPFVLMMNVPSVESFSPQYIAERVFATAKLIPNMLEVKFKSLFDPLDTLQDYEDFFQVLDLPEVAKVYQTDSSFAEQHLSGANPLAIRLLEENDPRAKVLEQIPSYQPDFEPMFDVDKELKAGKIYITDYTGTDENYRGPSSVQGGTHEKGRKYLPKPLAFFWWKSTGIGNQGKLVPIAIQLDASTNRTEYVPSNNKVYTPFETNPLDWLFAKLCVQIADANHHEMSSHLCRTHFVMEPIAIGTARQLAENHPLSLLLRPHFRFMLANNDLGEKSLINLGGIVDKILAGTLQESLQIAKVAYEKWNIKDFAFPTEINKRGMDKKDSEGNYLLPHYPYRDDGLLVWGHIHTFVEQYLEYFYPNPEDITGDFELQAWAKELSDSIEKNGGAVAGMPKSFTDVGALIEIVTTIIFICGPQHSAVNYPQNDYMAFAANMPLAAYRDIPKQSHQPEEQTTPDSNLQKTTKIQQTTASKAVAIKATLSQAVAVQDAEVETRTVEISEERITEDEILKLLPPFQKAADQLQTAFFLSAYRYDRLGYYDKSFQELYNQKLEEVFKDDSAIISIVMQFQQNLNMAEQEIDARNRQRVVPYPYLKPSLILNSISI